MRWREDGISGKDAMLGQHPIERLSRLELGATSVPQSPRCASAARAS
jgi:hypothetical protein